MSKSVHVVPNTNGWAVKKCGALKASTTAKTKAQAINKGKTISKNSNTDLYVHGKDGRIERKISFS